MGGAAASRPLRGLPAHVREICMRERLRWSAPSSSVEHAPCPVAVSTPRTSIRVLEHYHDGASGSSMGGHRQDGLLGGSWLGQGCLAPDPIAGRHCRRHARVALLRCKMTGPRSMPLDVFLERWCSLPCAPHQGGGVCSRSVAWVW